MSIYMSNACAAEDEHGPCGLSPNNSVHRNKRNASYHEYVPPVRKPQEPTRDELVTSALSQLYDAVVELRDTHPIPENSRLNRIIDQAGQTILKLETGL